jgi:hypothetical protein
MAQFNQRNANSQKQGGRDAGFQIGKGKAFQSAPGPGQLMHHDKSGEAARQEHDRKHKQYAEIEHP